MSDVSADFEKRLEEVKEYVKYLENLEKISGMSPTLMATMKASTMLMMYNVVESTMTSAVESIFLDIQNAQTSFDSIKDKVKVVVLNNVKKRNSEALVTKMRDESTGLSVASFRRNEVFSGNVDLKKIKEILKNFGMVLRVPSAGLVMDEVKHARNELAHGYSSFVETGRNLSADDLSKKVVDMEKILRQVVVMVNQYAANKAYLDQP
jgi:hypothetical protein